MYPNFQIKSFDIKVSSTDFILKKTDNDQVLFCVLVVQRCTDIYKYI